MGIEEDRQIDSCWDYINLNENGGKKMGSLKDEAMAYEPKQTLNIADLSEVPINIKLEDGEGMDDDGKVFKYKYTEINRKKYRIPSIVLGETKKILKLRPSVTKVKVQRSGSGLSTRYEVEALD